MNRRVPLFTLIAATALFLLGFLFADRSLAEWVHASRLSHAAVFVRGLGALDTIGGMRLSFWLAGAAAIVLGLIGAVWRRHARWPRGLVVAGVVQFATIATMIAGKDHFGRLRPEQVFERGDWSHVWFAGGASFPSGHSAFYFGLLLPLAACCPRRWQVAALLAVPLFAVAARIDMDKHFLSDVSMSALIAAVYTLIAAQLLRRWLTPPPSA